MNKNGLTLVELLAVIVVIAIISGIAVVSVNYITEKGKEGIYKNYEGNLRGSTENYLIENPNQIPKVDEEITITYETLTNTLFMNKMKDPKGGKCDSSYVVVKRFEDISNNYNLEYKVCLICDNYKSDGC